MRPTFKRRPLDFKLDIKNTSKHLNQISFKGIVHKSNIYEVDQTTLRDATNVYRNEDMVLVSRLPLKVEDMPKVLEWQNDIAVNGSILLNNYVLVDIVEIGETIIYVTKHNSDYRIVAKQNNGNYIVVAPIVNQYHISSIERYIFLFNNIGAVVLETNEFSKGWRPLEEFVEIPVTKRVSGQSSFEHPGNQFTESYKEEYIWSSDVIDMLPSGNAEVFIKQSPDLIEWTLEDANVNTEFRVIRPANIEMQPSDIVSVAIHELNQTPVVCVARNNHVLISYTGGVSWNKVLYPEDANFLEVASVSKSGEYFFFVSDHGVYRYTLGSEDTNDPEAWVLIKHELDPNDKLKGTGYYNMCNFVDSRTFAFVLIDSDETMRLYMMSPKLAFKDTRDSVPYNYDADTLGYLEYNDIEAKNVLSMARRDSAQNSIGIDFNDNGYITVVVAINDTNTTLKVIEVVSTSSSPATVTTKTLNQEHLIINSIKKDTETTIYGLAVDNNNWYKCSAIIDTDPLEIDYEKNLNIPYIKRGAPLNLLLGHISNFDVYSADGVAQLPIELLNKSRVQTVNVGALYYIHIDNKLYTNQMVSEGNTTLVYTRLSDVPFTEVPQVSHTDTELYLGFGDTLKITDSFTSGLDMYFNLPKINNQTFISDINGLLTISTEEVAIFLKDKIYLVTQEPDETLGYVYNYRNTRLSSGVRAGDSVINSLDGVYTFYPTARGLAVMNYQEDVATTDQIIEYITDNIDSIWKQFYKESETIQIVQFNDYVYISNGTNMYLMLDMRGLTWWKFEVPVPVYRIVTDQFNIKLIGNKLYSFDRKTDTYKDFGTDFINWRIESQPLHFELPSHYKNIKQIIYQFEESVDTLQTMLSQMKVYRKSISYNEPDVLRFKVDGYRTYIKRFNYWKVNELQWAMAADPDTKQPAQLKLTGLTIKYEAGEEVRS